MQWKKPYRCIYFDRCFSWASQLKHLKHIHIQERNPTSSCTVSGYCMALVGLQLVGSLMLHVILHPGGGTSYVYRYTDTCRLRPGRGSFSGLRYIVSLLYRHPHNMDNFVCPKEIFFFC